MIHALDYDNGHNSSLVHTGCISVSTCFAVAERMGKTSGQEFITAMVMGTDFMARLGLASKSRAGWHPTHIWLLGRRYGGRIRS
jgi:2-methylcitrate dehydratase PrpD